MKRRAKSQYLWVAMDFGYTLLAAIGIFAGGGWWLDSRFQTKPWFLLLGIGLGLGVGFTNLVRRLKYLERLGRSGPDSGEGKDLPGPKPPRRGESP